MKPGILWGSLVAVLGVAAALQLYIALLGSHQSPGKPPPPVAPLVDLDASPLLAMAASTTSASSSSSSSGGVPSSPPRDPANAVAPDLRQPPLSPSDIAFFISSSPKGKRSMYQHGPGTTQTHDYYSSRVLPGLATWAVNFPLLWIVFDNSTEAWEAVHHPRCRAESISLKTGDSTMFQSHHEAREFFCDAGRPIILTPCDNGYWGATGPCCKFEASLRHLVVVRQAIFQKAQWFIFADDDAFFSPAPLQSLLGAYSHSEVPTRYPIVLSRGEPPSSNFRFHKAKIRGKRNGNGESCANGNMLASQLQPAILSRRGIELIAPAILEGHAIERTCTAFGITHDYALGVLLWMFGFHWHVKARRGSIHMEMLGAVLEQREGDCNPRKVLNCSSKTFFGKLEELRLDPSKAILHGVKHAWQFQQIAELLESPAILRKLAAPFASASSWPPLLLPVLDYQFTEHRKRHGNWTMQGPSGTSGGSPDALTQRWPIFEPEDCRQVEEPHSSPFKTHVRETLGWSSTYPERHMIKDQRATAARDWGSGGEEGKGR